MDGHAPIPDGQKPLPEDEVEPGYYEWLEGEIAAGTRDADAGRTIPANEVWKKLGLDD